MNSTNADRRRDAIAIFQAAIDAVRPEPRMMRAITQPSALHDAVLNARRIIVVGGGKAGAGMVTGLEAAFSELKCLNRAVGVVNVPRDLVKPTRAIRLHPARPIGVNEPTPEAVAGVEEMLALVANADSRDVVLALISGGGSALLPAPAPGVTLADKIALTRELSKAGATIDELNCVRKHLSRIKGGGLATASRAGRLFGLIISDVVGDPLDVIASGPTVADPSTCVDASAVLAKYCVDSPQLIETPKSVERVTNMLLATNRDALSAAEACATQLGYAVASLGSSVVGDTRDLAIRIAATIRAMDRTQPRCLLMGGETTVSLPVDHGRGGRNQQFVLELITQLNDLIGITILSGGTDGEDGPTTAAGAVADADFRMKAAGLDVDEYRRRCDAYSLFGRTGDLLVTGLTGTNVMDVRLVLVSSDR